MERREGRREIEMRLDDEGQSRERENVEVDVEVEER